jgi:hypothetical protein
MAPFASLRREEACARDRIPGRAEEDLGERNPESPGTETGHHNEYRDLSHAYLPGFRTDAVQGSRTEGVEPPLKGFSSPVPTFNIVKLRLIPATQL